MNMSWNLSHSTEYTPQVARLEFLTKVLKKFRFSGMWHVVTGLETLEFSKKGGALEKSVPLTERHSIMTQKTEILDRYDVSVWRVMVFVNRFCSSFL
jgi:hypothetical protein